MIPTGYGRDSTPSFVLGKDTTSGTLVTTPLEELMRGLYVIGSTGSGKTVFLLNLMLQAIEQHIGCALLSPHGDAIDDILKRIPPGRERDVILLDVLSPSVSWGLNVFQCDTSDERAVSITTQIIIELFTKLFSDGDMAAHSPTMFETLLAITMLLMYNPGSFTLAEVPELLSTSDAALSLARKLPESQGTIQKWWEEYCVLKPSEKELKVGSFKRRLLAFLTDTTARRIFGQARTTLDLRAIMDSGKILLVKLDRQRPQLTSLLGATLVSLISAAAYSRENIPEDQRVPFCLFCDEYQRFSTPTFAEILTEARKFKIATTVAHQFRDQLDTKNKGATLNAGSTVVFQVSGQDAEELAKQFSAQQPTPPSGQGVLAGNMVQVLGREAHPDERARAFIQVYLRFLQTAAREEAEEIRERSTPRMTLYPTIRITSPSVSGSFVFEYIPDEVSQGLRRLNDWLYNCVREPTVPSAPDVEMLRLFSHVLGFSNYWTILHTIPTPLLMQTAQAMLKPGQTPEQEKETELRFIAAGVLYIKELLQEQRSRGEYPTVQASRTGWIYKGDSSRSAKTVPDAPPIALAAYTLERERYHTFVESLALLLEALREQPIFSDSRKYGIAPPASPRQIGDLEREIAQQLAHPSRYCARVRLGVAEYTIHALPLAAPSRSVSSLSQQITKQNVTSGYLRNRETVEQEIRERRKHFVSSALPALSGETRLTPLAEDTPEVPPVASAPLLPQGVLVPTPNGYVYRLLPSEHEEGQPFRLVPTPNGFLPVFSRIPAEPAASNGQTEKKEKRPASEKHQKRPPVKKTRQEEDEDV